MRNITTILYAAAFWLSTVIFFWFWSIVGYANAVTSDFPVFIALLLCFVLAIPGGIVFGAYVLWVCIFEHGLFRKERLALLFFIIAAGYGIFAGIVNLPLLPFRTPPFVNGVYAFTLVLVSVAVAYLILKRSIEPFLHKETHSSLFKNFKTNINMNNETNPQLIPGGNRILLKGITAAVLIIALWIPSLFIDSLVDERKTRSKEVAAEVSGKWASPQTLISPYMVIPYIETYTLHNGETGETRTPLVILPDTLNVDGELMPEVRSRSVFNILLYRSVVNMNGEFKPEWPADINPEQLDFSQAKLYWGLDDYKGIEENAMLTFNGAGLKSRPAPPAVRLHEKALSSPVGVDAALLSRGIPFQLKLKVRGSEGLHFKPLAANSAFSIKSSWANPSFDGDRLPVSRAVSDKGFTANWKFNEASLPIATVFKAGGEVKVDSFGVSLIQPADQYAKTERSIKYSLMVIALTFGLFFIMEITSAKPFHPVQYTLIGLALAIFYTLLLSISEYIHFDLAYFISAVAIVLMVSLYAKSHFKTWKAGGIFAAGLMILYGFMFVLLRLEDTALLIGSIGLFIILSAIMYASRKVDWYGKGERKIMEQE